MMFIVFFFFFKQKTAYEMRISDWSSDVCSSDLHFIGGHDTHLDRQHESDEDGPEAQHAQRKAEVDDGEGREQRDDDLADGDGQRHDQRVPQHQCHRRAGGLGDAVLQRLAVVVERSEEDTSELQSLMRISYAVCCLKKKKKTN